jgi:hypothetical protein
MLLGKYHAQPFFCAIANSRFHRPEGSIWNKAKFGLEESICETFEGTHHVFQFDSLGTPEERKELFRKRQ